MPMKLLIQAIAKFVAGLVLVGLVLFLPAGTFDYTNGWLLILILFVPMFLAGLYMFLKAPELLRKRLNAREKLGEQKWVVILSGIMFVAGFVVAGLTVRYDLYTFSDTAVNIAVLVFLAGYVLYAETLRENRYMSRVVEIQENQKVIDNGLYSVVRHPMYTATIILFLSIPVVLGSVYSLVIFLAYPFIIVKRIKSEEEFLKNELDGYLEYTEKVKYRLIPFLW